MALSEPIPAIRFGPITRTMLALYAGASGDHNPIHIDSDFARESGQSDVFAHGMLTFGVLARVVTEWAGQDRLRSFDARFTSITHLNDIVCCSGRIVERFEDHGRRLLRIAVEATTDDGRPTIVGEATVEDD